MPVISKILETALYVDDMDRSAAFYQTLFGFPVISQGPRLTALGVPSQQVLLLFKKGASLADAPGGSHDGTGQTHVAFAIPAADFDAWEEVLARNGVAVTERRTWDRGGRSIYFRDPDGHLIELATPGVWSNY
jgi:catechol 2,3-dioxygenase-like lactoylglutathione lyase family enzyme